jgi:hypothetical protein
VKVGAFGDRAGSGGGGGGLMGRPPGTKEGTRAESAGGASMSKAGIPWTWYAGAAKGL